MPDQPNLQGREGRRGARGHLFNRRRPAVPTFGQRARAARRAVRLRGRRGEGRAIEPSGLPLSLSLSAYRTGRASDQGADDYVHYTPFDSPNGRTKGRAERCSGGRTTRRKSFIQGDILTVPTVANQEGIWQGEGGHMGNGRREEQKRHPIRGIRRRARFARGRPPGEDRPSCRISAVVVGLVSAGGGGVVHPTDRRAKCCRRRHPGGRSCGGRRGTDRSFAPQWPPSSPPPPPLTVEHICRSRRRRRGGGSDRPGLTTNRVWKRGRAECLNLAPARSLGMSHRRKRWRRRRGRGRGGEGGAHCGSGSSVRSVVKLHASASRDE